MQSTINAPIRDVSKIQLRPGWQWSDEVIVCPHCGRATPIPVTWNPKKRRWTRWVYPCDCKTYSAEVERIERQDRERYAPRAVSVPERFEESAGRVDTAALAGTLKEGCGVYLHGGNGTGKTTAAYAVASRLAGEGWRVEITTLSQIKSDLHDTYSTAETQHALFGRLSRCDLLVLDDLGKEVPSEATCELLYRIVNERYERRRNVLITSNFSRGKLAARFAEGCNESTAKAIASRLSEMTVSIEMDGPDARSRR